MKYIFCIIIGLVSIPILSLSQSSDCPKPSKKSFSVLCTEIEGQEQDQDEESPYNYRFERTIDEMACVNRKTDNDSVIIRKVQAWWNKYKFDCHCNRANFAVADGNILKYAAQQRFEGFWWTIKQYKLDYNFLDPKDGKTLLDFVNQSYQRSLSIEPKSQKTADLKKIHDNLRTEGALYSSELKTVK